MGWLSMVDRVQLSDKPVSLLQALLKAFIAWYILRIIRNYLAYRVRLFMCFSSFSAHLSFVLAAWHLFIFVKNQILSYRVSTLSPVIDSFHHGLFSSKSSNLHLSQSLPES